MEEASIGLSKEEQPELLSILEKERIESGERIPVNWSSFVKIKKKNYLEDYIHIK